MMKKTLLILMLLAASIASYSQKIFTVVYATSSDNFLNIRTSPSGDSDILGKLYSLYHGLGNGVLLESRGNWSMISTSECEGWVASKYLGSLQWYSGDGPFRIIADKWETPVYRETYGDDASLDLFTTLEEGTIISDHFEENGEYYILTTAHDNLYIKKSDAKQTGSGMVYCVVMGSYSSMEECRNGLSKLPEFYRDGEFLEAKVEGKHVFRYVVRHFVDKSSAEEFVKNAKEYHNVDCWLWPVFRSN